MAANESAAIHLIKRAVELDTNKRYAEALEIKDIQDEKKKTVFREKISSYFDRAEKLKILIEELKESGKYHEQIIIEENSIGHSYEKKFSRFFEEEILDYVEINDPYIRSKHQTHNFLRFCEMAVKFSRKIDKIILITTRDDSSNNQQDDRLNDIRNSLQKRNVELIVKYSSSLHDREIKLSNGWIIKIGRGLDYFKAPESREKLCIGFHDLDLRHCYETTIDIFHQNSTKLSK